MPVPNGMRQRFVALMLRRRLRRGNRVSATRSSTWGREARFSATIGAIAAAAAIAQAIFAFLQVRIARESAVDADKQATRLIEAAERLARSGEESIRSNESSAKNSLEQGRVALAQTAEANAKTAGLIEKAQEVFAAQTYPLLKLAGYQLQASIEDKATRPCLDTATGVGVYFMNQSAVPVQLKEVNFRLDARGEDLFPGAPTRRRDSEGKILTTKEQAATGIVGLAFAKAYANPAVASNEPPFTAHLAILYQSLPTARCYRYAARMKIFADCRIPNQTNWSAEDERISDAACPKPEVRITPKS